MHSVSILQDQPFTQKHPEALFNMALFLTHLDSKGSKKFRGVSKVYPFQRWNNNWLYYPIQCLRAVLYTLAKQGKALGAYKVARHAYDQLQTLAIPQRFQEVIDLGSITIRSKPYQDKEVVFYWCQHKCMHVVLPCIRTCYHCVIVVLLLTLYWRATGIVALTANNLLSSPLHHLVSERMFPLASDLVLVFVW